MIELADVADKIVVYHRPKDYMLAVHTETEEKKVNKIVRDVIKKHRAGTLRFVALKAMLKDGNQSQLNPMVQESLF